MTASVTYDPEASTFDAEIDEATAGSPDAIVVISFAEGGPLIAGLLEAGVTPDQLYGGRHSACCPSWSTRPIPTSSTT